MFRKIPISASSKLQILATCLKIPNYIICSLIVFIGNSTFKTKSCDFAKIFDEVTQAVESRRIDLPIGYKPA